MKKIKPLIFLSILLLFSGCIEDDSEPRVKSCISNWRSGNWETNYGISGSGILEDAINGETCTFRGIFMTDKNSRHFSVIPIEKVGYYCVGWAHSFQGESDCTPELLISTNYIWNGDISVDLKAIKNNNGKIEAFGKVYEKNLVV